jgi:hypothetical protein
VATVEERLLLKPPRGGAQVPDEGDRRRTAGLLQALVIARLSEEFQNAEVDVPRELKKNQLSANALSNRVRALGELKSHPKCPKVNAQAFSEWRQARAEAIAAAEAEARAAAEVGGSRVSPGRAVSPVVFGSVTGGKRSRKDA